MRSKGKFRELSSSYRACTRLLRLICIVCVWVLLQFSFTTPAHGACPVPEAYGYQPYPPTIAPVFDKAARNQLGSSGPTLPKIGKGWPDYVMVDPTIPKSIIKAIGYFETHGVSGAGQGWKQFRAAYGQYGYTVISPDCGYGIMQITSGMSGGAGFDPAKVASDYTYNIGTGALFLCWKWNGTQAIGNNDPAIYEDWYYAVWDYNGAPDKNNPNNPIYQKPFPVYNGSNRSQMPYQEAVWSLIRNPWTGNALYNDVPVWDVIPITSPNPYDIRYPTYPTPGKNYIPTPLPYHTDSTTQPDLIVEDIWIEPAQFYPGDEVKLYQRTKNIGDGDAVGTFRIQRYFDGSAVSHADKNGLAAGESYTSYYTYIWPLDCNPHTIKVVVDLD